MFQEIKHPRFSTIFLKHKTDYKFYLKDILSFDLKQLAYFRQIFVIVASNIIWNYYYLNSFPRHTLCFNLAVSLRLRAALLHAVPHRNTYWG